MISDLLALGSAAVFGAADFSGGIAARRMPATLVVLFAHIVGLLLALTLAILLPGDPGSTVWLAGAAAGVSGSIGLVALYHGLATGRMAVVAPISALVATAGPVVYGVWRGERPATTAWVGVVVALVSIVAVSWSGSLRGSGMREALVAGLGFAGFFIALSATSTADGLWPLVPARLASILLIGAVLAVMRTRPAIPREARWPVLLAGTGDMAANALYLAAVQRGLLSSVVVLSSLYPAFTVLLGRVLVAEPVSRVQWVGIGLAVAAVALLAG